MENMVTTSQLSSYYKGKKVFLTGHTGFKGSWMMQMLLHLGATVKGYALAPEYSGGLFDLFPSQDGSESIIADIRDKDRLQKELLSFEPDFVFHLAAQPLVRRSYQIPAETFEVNVAGTANLLEAVRGLQKKCTVVVITTDKVYQNKEQHVLYTEEDTLGGYDPYSASKACTELVVSSFRNSFFNPQQYSNHQKGIASARAGNVIGGGDWSEDRLVPDIVKSLINGKVIDVRNPFSVRPWQHVLEPLGGYLLLGGLLSSDPVKYATAYNFGPNADDHLTVEQLVKKAIESFGSGEWNDRSDKNAPHEAGLLMLSIERAKQELHWIPKLKAPSSIEWTIEWYKQPADNKAAFTLQQIAAYLAL